MSSWIETELKWLLPDALAFERVRQALGPGRVALQVNHFFDRADGAFAAARISVRLRSEGDLHRLTLKGDERAASGGALSQRIELEADLTPAEFEAALARGLDLEAWIARLAPGSGKADTDAERARAPELVLFLARLAALAAPGAGGPLRRHAGFTNRRESIATVLHDAAGPLAIELALDRTELPGGRIDHEIEVELGPGTPSEITPERVERALVARLRTLGVGPLRPATSKLARLLEQRAAGADAAG